MNGNIVRRATWTVSCLALLFGPVCRSATQPEAAAGTPVSYAEPHRPQFHFSPPSMWMNDPNGLVYYEGEYHLFYQYYPGATVWGPMHWGHAVSRDLVTWEHLPIALYPDELGYIFSGSVVVDWNNTSGFGRAGKPPLVAIFTYHDPARDKAGTNDDESQGIAYSNDRGRTWTRYRGNPVLPNTGKQGDFRDPKVSWHQESSRWIMALSVSDHVEFWGSPNLKDWQYLSSFGKEWGAHGGTWECPDLIPLRIAGSDETRWVLIVSLNPGGPQGGSGTQYFVGHFDGKTYTLDEGFRETLRQEPAAWLDWGRDNYAGVTWSDVPKDDGRRLFIGWMSNWDYAQHVPTQPWRSAMTLPRSLRLVRTPGGYRLFTEPVRELERLRTESASLPGMKIVGTVDLGDHVKRPMATSELLLEFDARRAGASRFGVVLSNARGESYRIGFDGASNEFYSDRRRAGDHSFSDKFADRVHRAPRLSSDSILRMRLFVDVASVELFADDGATTLTDIFFPSEPFDRVSLFSEGGDAWLLRGDVHRLKGIW